MSTFCVHVFFSMCIIVQAMCSSALGSVRVYAAGTVSVYLSKAARHDGEWSAGVPLQPHLQAEKQLLL